MSCCYILKPSTPFGSLHSSPKTRQSSTVNGMPTPAFNAAAELSRNDKSGKVSTESILRGYGLYKVVTAGVGACPLHTAKGILRHSSTAKGLHGHLPSCAPRPGLAGPDAADCPNVLNVMAVERRQKWFAHEVAWEECGGNIDKAQELYITHTEQCQGLEPGSLSK